MNMVLVAAKTAFSVAANSDSDNQATGTFLNVGKGIHRLIAKPSATGMKVTMLVGGLTVCRNAGISGFGTSGTLDRLANEIFNQEMPPGQIELYFSNTTGGAVTVDYILEFFPTK